MEDIIKQQQETNALVGETLILMQKIDSALRVWLVLVNGKEQAVVLLDRILSRDQKTLKYLVKELKKHVEVPDDYKDILLGLLVGRNILLHDLFNMPWYNMASSKGLTAINNFCHELLRDGRVSLSLVVKFIMKGVDVYKLKPEDAISVEVILERIIITSRSFLEGHRLDEYFERFKQKN